MVSTNFSVKTALSAIKKKKNTTTNEEKVQIINLIEAAKNTYDLMFTDEVVSLNKLISMTHELLEPSRLSNMSKRAISYLYKRKDGVEKLIRI